MLKDFFESPEIAVIFATKQKDRKSVDINESSRLRVGKHSRKREHNTKRPVRNKTRGHRQSSADMFSARKSRVDNAERIANLHERIDYYDYDNETGTIIKKKHSVFDCGSKQSPLEYDKSECDVDIKRDDFMKQVAGDLNTRSDGYCQSDSAYETNHDDFTDSLERIMIKDDIAANGGSAIDKDGNEGSFGISLAKRESPYRRCRSSAICGRNCEICRGKNNNILPTNKYRQSRKQTVNSANDKQRIFNIEAFPQKDSNASDKQNKKNCGMFSSKAREDTVNFHDNGNMYLSESESTQGIVNPGYNVQVDREFEAAQIDIELRDHSEGNRTSPIAISTPDFVTSEQEDGYYSEMPHVVEHQLASYGIHGHTHELLGFANNREYVDEHMIAKPGREDEVYEAFVRGPHLIMLYDFKAEHENDVSVWKGEVVLLLDNRDRDWVWVATDTNNEGYVPRSLTTPYSYCEECRQEELRRKQALEKDEVASNISIPRSTSTNSRSSLASIRSSTKYSADNSPLLQRKDSPIARSTSQIHSDPLPLENCPDMNYTSSYDFTFEANQSPYLQSNANPKFHNQKRPSLRDNQNHAENRTITRTNSSTSLKRDRPSLTKRQQSFEAGNTHNTSPRRTKTVSKQLSLRSSSSNSGPFESNSLSQELMLWQEREKDRMLKDSIKLVALSSYRTNEQGKLPVTAGDSIYVHLKDQKVPNWLWVYSPESNKFGFIPESVVDQLKSSIV